MPMTALADPFTRTFRAGGGYDLVVFDRLPPAEQIVLAVLRDDPDFYGVLRPRDASGRTLRAVDRDTALLYLTLQAPGPLPFFAWEGNPDAARRAVVTLVLDGVLEVEDDGRFVSGAAAIHLTGGTRDATADTALTKLSRAALRYGQALGIDDPSELAGRLYTFGRQPVTPGWERRVPDRDAVLAFLGAGPGMALRHRLDAEWERAPESEPGGWIAWSRSKRGPTRSSEATYKLYISPQPNDLPPAFGALVDVLSSRPRARFKVGADATGILRPDKLVAYFESMESLLDVATALTPRLADISPHGVAFTAEIAHDGLLSWGIDPPPSSRVLAWQGYDSWRLWLVRRLSAALVAAQHDAQATVEPWQFALERLRQEGVDVDRWTPSDGMWRAA
jgi:hypothetical protein